MCTGVSNFVLHFLLDLLRTSFDSFVFTSYESSPDLSVCVLIVPSLPEVFTPDVGGTATGILESFLLLPVGSFYFLHGVLVQGSV